jgi:hypothetical protein
MLLDMKSRTEGIRALIMKLAVHADKEILSEDEDTKKYHKGQLDLLVPLVKAYGSDQAFTVAATAIQVYGGAGFLRDHPVEQHCRDAKIFSIYEGTNHIQALDLVGRQLGKHGGSNFQGYLKDIGTFVAKHGDNKVMGFAIRELGEAAQSLGATAMLFLGWYQGGKPQLVPLNANKFLEMMSVTTVAWLLLEQGIIAEAKLADLAEDDSERNFYLGKRYSSLYYANLELGGVVAGAKHIAEENQSALLIPEDAFATI